MSFDQSSDYWLEREEARDDAERRREQRLEMDSGFHADAHVPVDEIPPYTEIEWPGAGPAGTT
jgi:hypothetical protein